MSDINASLGMSQKKLKVYFRNKITSYYKKIIYDIISIHNQFIMIVYAHIIYLLL